MDFSLYYFLFLLVPLTQLFLYQINTFDINNPIICLKVFKSNNFFGLLVLINILIGKFS